ncbi:hypothetical protein FSHL1_002598 [Fusarium sambucinum]
MEKAKTIEHEGVGSERTQSITNPRVTISALQKRARIEQDNLDQLRASYTEFQRRKTIEPTGLIDKVLEHLGDRIKALTATQPTGLRRLLHRLKLMILNYLLIAVRTYRSMFGHCDDFEQHDIRQQNQLSMDDFDRKIKESMSRLKNLKRDEKRAINDALTSSEDAARSAREKLKREELEQKAREELQQQVTMRQRDTAVYKNLAEDERQSMKRLQSEHELLAKDLRTIANDRELFDFWNSALSKRTRASSSSTRITYKGKAGINFREHILLKSISELNALLTQILTVLYDDTRHANMATGMLHSIFHSDTSSASVPASVLDSKLAVNASLAYGKRSSGERKRVDLALFFAVLQLARAKSAHRAHYVLIDEVFDNLDNAGQAAVIRWLSVMSQTVVGWVVVITHSQFLIERDLGHDTAGVLVVRTNMGQEGTELSVNGRRIGRD